MYMNSVSFAIFRTFKLSSTVEIFHKKLKTAKVSLVKGSEEKGCWRRDPKDSPGLEPVEVGKGP